jgi:hypothetical protein
MPEVGSPLSAVSYANPSQCLCGDTAVTEEFADLVNDKI